MKQLNELLKKEEEQKRRGIDGPAYSAGLLFHDLPTAEQEIVLEGR
ncbi:MAG: hypothetical protein AABZ15_13560 [Nitrospirota bacterium]